LPAGHRNRITAAGTRDGLYRQSDPRREGRNRRSVSNGHRHACTSWHRAGVLPGRASVQCASTRQSPTVRFRGGRARGRRL